MADIHVLKNTNISGYTQKNQSTNGNEKGETLHLIACWVFFVLFYHMHVILFVNTCVSSLSKNTILEVLPKFVLEV